MDGIEVHKYGAFGQYLKYRAPAANMTKASVFFLRGRLPAFVVGMVPSAIFRPRR